MLGLIWRWADIVFPPSQKQEEQEEQENPNQNLPEGLEFAYGFNLMEDDRWLKTTFDGRRPLMENDI